jgi:hypothetical protein
MAEAKEKEQTKPNAQPTPPNAQQTDKHYIISGSQVQSLLRYLFTRPYGEVVQGIEVLAKGLRELDSNINADFVAKSPDGKK